MPATTGSPSSANTTAPPAAICTPGSPSATNSTSPHHAAPSSSTGRDAPVLLISAGIGATPVLAMLQALAEEHSDREIWWLHGARSSRDHSFAAEARALLASLPNVRAHVCYSRPGPNDLEGRDFDSAGRLTASLLAELEPPRDAEAYLCGPTPFMDEISAASGGDGDRRLTHPHRTVRARAGSDARHRRDTRADAPPTRRQSRERPDDRVRPQQPRHPLEQRLRQPARARRSMRRTRPLVVPHRRLPQLRDHPHRRQSSTTAPTRSNPPPTEARSSAAHSRATTWCSICDAAHGLMGKAAGPTRLGSPRHRAVGGLQRWRLRHHPHSAGSGDQATWGRGFDFV